jgi:hypothetical protein
LPATEKTSFASDGEGVITALATTLTAMTTAAAMAASAMTFTPD